MIVPSCVVHPLDRRADCTPCRPPDAKAQDHLTLDVQFQDDVSLLNRGVPGFSDQSIKKGFIRWEQARSAFCAPHFDPPFTFFMLFCFRRKVYGILTVQVLFTFAMCAVFSPLVDADADKLYYYFALLEFPGLGHTDFSHNEKKYTLQVRFLSFGFGVVVFIHVITVWHRSIAKLCDACRAPKDS